MKKHRPYKRTYPNQPYGKLMMLRRMCGYLCEMNADAGYGAVMFIAGMVGL
jgi:hypothetical protein